MSEIAIFLAQITDPIRIAMACLVGYMVAKTRWSSIAWPLAVTATFAIVIAYSVPRLMWAFLLGKAMQNNRIDKLFNPFQEPTLAELPNYGWDLFTQVFNRETFDEVKSLVEQRYHDCSVLWGRSGRTGDEAERFNVRMPEGLRDRLRASAEENRRSMNAELIFHLDRALPLQVRKAATGVGSKAKSPAAVRNAAA